MLYTFFIGHKEGEKFMEYLEHVLNERGERNETIQ